MPKIGAHVSTAGGLTKAFENAQNIKAEAIQIFISPPRQWFKKNHTPDEIAEFVTLMQQTKIEPVFIHGTYLINLAAESDEHVQKSIDWLVYALNTSAKIGSAGVIFHLGSHKGNGFDSVVTRVAKNIQTVLNQSDPTSTLILEIAAGQGGAVGTNFEQLGTILKLVDNKRAKICLDTCHAYASNYDLKTKSGIDRTLDEFDQQIGLERLAALHANDSKFEIGSKRDRHANIGEGFIGAEGFTNLLNNPRLNKAVFLLEVPGFDGSGPDAKNVSILKDLRQS